MLCYVFQTPLPLRDVKVFIPEPRIAICSRTTPRRLRHMIIEMYIYPLLGALCGNSVKNLHLRVRNSNKVNVGVVTDLQSRCRC